MRFTCAGSEDIDVALDALAGRGVPEGAGADGAGRRVAAAEALLGALLAALIARVLIVADWAKAVRRQARVRVARGSDAHLAGVRVVASVAPVRAF